MALNRKTRSAKVMEISRLMLFKLSIKIKVNIVNFNLSLVQAIACSRLACRVTLNRQEAHQYAAQVHTGPES